MKDIEKRVLVVEGNEFMQEVYGQWIAGPDMVVLKSLCLKDALEVCRSEKPDAIILNLDISEYKGIEFLREIFKGKQVPDIPVLAISARNDLATKLAAFVSGAKRYLVKPFEKSDLANSLHSIVTKRQITDDRVVAFG